MANSAKMTTHTKSGGLAVPLPPLCDSPMVPNAGVHSPRYSTLEITAPTKPMV